MNATVLSTVHFLKCCHDYQLEQMPEDWTFGGLAYWGGIGPCPSFVLLFRIFSLFLRCVVNSMVNGRGPSLVSSCLRDPKYASVEVLLSQTVQSDTIRVQYVQSRVIGTGTDTSECTGVVPAPN